MRIYEPSATWARTCRLRTSRKKLRLQQDSEAANKERMQELSKRMDKLFKDAVRNGEIEKESLKKMSNALQAMKELARTRLTSN